MRHLLIIGAMALLAGCERVISSPCITLPAYSRDFQNKLADQFLSLPAEARQVIEDAGDLRAKVRAMCP